MDMELFSKYMEGHDKAWKILIQVFKDRNKMSAKRRLESYEAVIPYLIFDHDFSSYVAKHLTKEMPNVRDNKRWTEEEDNALVEMAVLFDGNLENLFFMAPMWFGRTPDSVKTRLSYLVGKKRLTVKVEGKFEGDFEGELVKGQISGLVHKK